MQKNNKNFIRISDHNENLTNRVFMQEVINWEYINEGIKKLTTKENMLLRLLVQNQNELLDRQAALRAVWGDDNYFNGRSMDVYIAKLRKLLKDDTNIEIMNVHGIGFKLLVKQ